MIPILFKADATDFSTFGIGALTEALTCEVTEERNGTFECKLTCTRIASSIATTTIARIILYIQLIQTAKLQKILHIGSTS